MHAPINGAYRDRQRVRRGVSRAQGITDIDVYLVDLNLPGEDGLSLVRRLRSTSPDVGIIVLTARDANADRVKGYDCGADIYMVKPIHPPELIAALRRFARNKEPDVTSAEASPLTLCKGRLTGTLGQVRLSYDETIVLEALVRAPAQKMANWQLACLLDADLDEIFKSNLPVRMARLRKNCAAWGPKGRPCSPCATSATSSPQKFCWIQNCKYQQNLLSAVFCNVCCR